MVQGAVQQSAVTLTHANLRRARSAEHAPISDFDSDIDGDIEGDPYEGWAPGLGMAIPLCALASAADRDARSGVSKSGLRMGDGQGIKLACVGWR